MTEDDDILAAEYALGLLAPDEAHAAEARMKTDAPLSLRVAWWRDQLGPLADEAATEPPAHVWSGIESRLGANDNPVDTARPWKWATGGMGAVAATLAAVLWLQSIPIETTKPSSPESMVASLSGDRGMAVTVSYDSINSRLLVTPVSLDPGKGDAELWVIPVGETVPVSMGVIDATGAGARSIDAKHAALLAPGATFAISQEAKGGSPTGKAQGPIVASGKIIRV